MVLKPYPVQSPVSFIINPHPGRPAGHRNAASVHVLQPVSLSGRSQGPVQDTAILLRAKQGRSADILLNGHRHGMLDIVSADIAYDMVTVRVNGD